MKQTLCLFLFFFGLTNLFAQQLYLDFFTGFNRTAYATDTYNQKKSYLTTGARIAAGADHLQIGGEYRANLTHPSFEVANQPEEHRETYYGAFIRYKISKYPAMRFGLVLRGGAGLHNIETRYENNPAGKLKYDPVPGFNGGVGFSIPTFRSVMLELGYTYNYISRPEISDQGTVVQAFNSSYHALQAGLSLNFVFGKRAEEYRVLRENQRNRS